MSSKVGKKGKLMIPSLEVVGNILQSTRNIDDHTTSAWPNQKYVQSSIDTTGVPRCENASSPGVLAGGLEDELALLSPNIRTRAVVDLMGIGVPVFMVPFSISSRQALVLGCTNLPSKVT
ncbi:Na+/H+ antiporter domain protein [Striga asiatica]|uniref:Na+/H+ antiporter domain protein n=1 Tax=Striga asiatica TaxID=4170 RepID=A0A5A7PND8_STRAF|nr:Na+/H+ antiporter domain protein [Striga asiatica]